MLHQSPITLISLASELEIAELGNKIKNLGFDNLVIFDNNSSPTSNSHFSISSPNRELQDSLYVFQIKNLQQYKEQVLKSLQQVRTSRILGLFQHNEPGWDYDVVRLCNEVASWPCSESELSCRMLRLTGCGQNYKKIERKLFVKLNILGESPAFTNVLDNVAKLSTCDAPVYIDGETGTGKELIARAVHYLSERSDHPFVPANCGALPDNLIENELFGHERGAFTDARAAQHGLVAHAEGGTLFLDEIEALSAKAQVVLLRFIQDLEYRPLGANKSKKANIRLLTASNESLQELVDAGKFRQDLYYRLNIMNVNLPPLRERNGDIPILANHFLNNFQQKYKFPAKAIHPKTLKGMLRYHWPGNVRELENMLHREYLLTEDGCIRIKYFESINDDRRNNQRDRRRGKLFGFNLHEAKQKLVSEFEMDYLDYVLSQTSGNISRAARLAGKERRTFAKLLDKYAVDISRYRNNRH